MTRTILVALLALAPALAFAQGAPRSVAEGGPAIAPPPRTAAPGEAAAAPEVQAQAPANEAVPPPDTYTIKPGDTLWDLSGRFLNNPWYWPKIWSYNPDISNPHWIYPGNILKFYPSQEEAPTRVEPVGPGTPIAAATSAAEENAAALEAEEELGEPAKELEDFSRADLKAPAPVEQTDAVAVAGPYKIGFTPHRSRYALHDTFVTPRELAESGEITAAFEERAMLATLDRAYAKFEKPAEVKVGETYIIYKTKGAIRHPAAKDEKEIFGYQSQIIGAAKIVAVEDKAATLIITQAMEPIERGALLGPWSQKFYRPVDRRPNKKAVAGQIIGTQYEVVTQYGENHMVFLDRGEKDGVEEGNVFTVLRSGEQYAQDLRRATWDDNLPIEVVGQLLVVDVKENASTALVTRSMKELLLGDRVEMRPDEGSGGN